MHFALYPQLVIITICLGSSIDENLAVESYNGESRSSGGAVSAATATAAGLVIGAGLGPVVGVCAAAVSFLSAYGFSRHAGSEEETHQEVSQRRLLGQPCFALELVSDNIDRARTRVKDPIVESTIATSDKLQELQVKLDRLEALPKRYGASLDRAVALRPSAKNEEPLASPSIQLVAPGAVPVKENLLSGKREGEPSEIGVSKSDSNTSAGESDESLVF